MRLLARSFIFVSLVWMMSWSSSAYADEIVETLYLNTENRLTPAPVLNGFYSFAYSKLNKAFSGRISGGSTLSGVPVHISLWLAAFNKTGPNEAAFTVTLYKNATSLGSKEVRIPTDRYWRYVIIQMTPDQSISPCSNVDARLLGDESCGGAVETVLVEDSAGHLHNLGFNGIRIFSRLFERRDHPGLHLLLPSIDGKLQDSLFYVKKNLLASHIL